MHTFIITCFPIESCHITWISFSVKSCPKFVIGTLDTKNVFSERGGFQGLRNAAVEIFTLAAEFFFQADMAIRRLIKTFSIRFFTHLIDLYMSQHFSVKNDSKLNSSYLNLTVFSIVFYQWKISDNNVIIDLMSYSQI